MTICGRTGTATLWWAVDKHCVHAFRWCGATATMGSGTRGVPTNGAPMFMQFTYGASFAFGLAIQGGDITDVENLALIGSALSSRGFWVGSYNALTELEQPVPVTYSVASGAAYNFLDGIDPPAGGGAVPKEM